MGMRSLLDSSIEIESNEYMIFHEYVKKLFTGEVITGLPSPKSRNSTLKSGQKCPLKIDASFLTGRISRWIFLASVQTLKHLSNLRYGFPQPQLTTCLTNT